MPPCSPGVRNTRLRPTCTPRTVACRRVTLTVGIDARAAAEVPAGRGRYVRELLSALDALPEARDVRFVLYAREPWGARDPGRFSWTPVTLPDPAWPLATAARASREVDVLLSTNSYL